MVKNVLSKLKVNWKHIVILGILLVYLFIANTYYVNQVLVYGKPAGRNPKLPEPTQQLVFSVNRLDPINQDGEDLYVLWGYAFPKTNPNIENQVIKIILHSVKENFIFQTEVLPRPDVTKAFPKYKMSLDKAGFKVLITKYALPIDNYQIGILIEDKNGNPLYYQMTNRFIERSPNTLRFIGDS